MRSKDLCASYMIEIDITLYNQDNKYHVLYLDLDLSAKKREEYNQSQEFKGFGTLEEVLNDDLECGNLHSSVSFDSIDEVFTFLFDNFSELEIVNMSLPVCKVNNIIEIDY